jgi:hypothetical protein
VAGRKEEASEVLGAAPEAGLHLILTIVALLLALLVALLAFTWPGCARAGAPAPEATLLAASHIERSAKQVRAFRAANPCPATNEARGACPGFVVDHIVPLCAGGADHPQNMQWQTVAAAKAKDREEHAQCRALRKANRLTP